MFPWDENYDEIDYDSLPEIAMNFEHGKWSYGQNAIGYFRSELIEAGITTTFDAIKSGMRTATSRKEIYHRGQIVKFKKKGTSEILICRIIESSYPVDSISSEDWSKNEGWDITYLESNPDINKKFQFRFKYLKSINI